MESKLILLIEDEPLILMDVESALTDEGFEVISAHNAEQAIKAFEKDSSRIVGVVTDIRLGKGKSGWDLGHHVREAIPGMPVVYMSGDSSHEWEAHGVPNSVMVEKPFVHSQIITALATLMNHPDHS